MIGRVQLALRMCSCFTTLDEIENSREKFFLENGSRVLKELITSWDGKSNPIKTFSAQELQRATNNYHPDLIMSKHEGYGHFSRKYMSYILYKGICEDGIISIKRFTDHEALTLEQCINEVAIASQINHRNVLKLLGCCLETQIPVLVYEFAGNGSLCNHIYNGELCSSDNYSQFSWDKKLKIATEIAYAVTYIHTATSSPIIHRGIKSSNIFLDQNYVAKLFDFGLSIAIPTGETHVEAEAIGTFGFLAPESLAARRFTEKSDVYGFGAVLLELLTGRRVRRVYDISWEISVTLNLDQSDDNLILNGHSSLIGEDEKQHPVPDKEKVTELYLNANLLKEGNKEQLMACGELALRCLKLNPEERPTMKEVTLKLRQIKSFPHSNG